MLWSLWILLAMLMLAITQCSRVAVTCSVLDGEVLSLTLAPTTQVWLKGESVSMKMHLEYYAIPTANELA